MKKNKGFTHKNILKKISGGFTLIELLVVVAIIGILASVVLAALSKANKSGNDGGIKENLRNANAQGEIFWNTNTAAVNSYTNVCKNVAQIGGANTLYLFMTTASKDAGLGGTYTWDGTGSLTTATCNDSSSAWAGEVPLSSASGTNQMWCVDSTGKSKQESTSIGAGTACN